MSIKITFDFIKSQKNSVMIGDRNEFDNFNLLSTQIEELLCLQLRKKEKDKLQFSLENQALVILYEDTEDSEQNDIEGISLEDRLIYALEAALEEVNQYLNYFAIGKQLSAINYNIERKKKPSKMQMILVKLASKKVTLVTDSGLKLCVNKTDNYGKTYEEQNAAAINCKITKPELIKNCKAEFHYEISGQKYVATLDIPAEFEEDILNCALTRTAVDIEFDYIEKVNVERKYSGCLTAFEVAKVVKMESITEELF